MYRKRTRALAAPVAMSSSVEQQTGQKQIHLSGREFVLDVVASALAVPTLATVQTQFQVTNTKINPSDTSVFSWLSGIAQKFEEYRFDRLMFMYEPQCNTTTTGSVGLFFEPDPTNAPPQSWQTFTNTGCNTHGAPWAKHVLVIPRRYLTDRKSLYVRDQFVDASQNPPVTLSSSGFQDPLEYFLGIIGEATQGVTVTNSTGGTTNVYQVLGKVYIEYGITLIKATLDQPPRVAQFGFGVGSTSNSVIPANYKMGPNVSSYWASLAGNGLKIIPNAWQAPGSMLPLFGVSSPQTSGTIGAMVAKSSAFYGDQLFTWNVSIAGAATNVAKSGVIAVQTLDLMYVICMAGATALATPGAVWSFQNQNGDISTLSGYNQSFATGADAGGGVVAVGTLHIQQGDSVSLNINNTVQITSPASFIWLVPCTWGLDQ